MHPGQVSVTISSRILKDFDILWETLEKKAQTTPASIFEASTKPQNKFVEYGSNVLFSLTVGLYKYYDFDQGLQAYEIGIAVFVLFLLALTINNYSRTNRVTKKIEFSLSQIEIIETKKETWSASISELQVSEVVHPNRVRRGKPLQWLVFSTPAGGEKYIDKNQFDEYTALVKYLKLKNLMSAPEELAS